MRVFALSLLLSVLCLSASALAADTPPKVKTVLAVKTDGAPNPIPSCRKTPTIPTGGIFEQIFQRNPNYYVYKIGDLEMRSECLPPQTEITVANQQPVQITLATYAGYKCVAVPTFKSDPKPDYGAIFAAFVPKFAPAESPTRQLGERQRLTLPTVSNGTLTVVVSCGGGNDPTVLLPRTVIIHYSNVAQFSLSAGVLVSSLGKKIYGTLTSQTGTGVNGVASVQDTIGLTSSSRLEFIPIAFLNTYISGTQRMQLDFQAGVGINPNGSKTQVEYFLGPAIATHGFYISPGMHVARAPYLSGGFSLGEVIPSGVTVPVVYRATYKFGISLSYAPSLKGSSSK